jgi:hypothetical protein
VDRGERNLERLALTGDLEAALSLQRLRIDRPCTERGGLSHELRDDLTKPGYGCGLDDVFEWGAFCTACGNTIPVCWTDESLFARYARTGELLEGEAAFWTGRG